MTEILQNDAASCMTVHDKVEVIIHHPQGHSSFQVRPSQLQISHCLCTHLRDVIFCSICKSSPFFSHLLLLFLSGRYITRLQAPLSSPLFIPTLTYFLLLSSVCRMLIFLRGPLSARCLIVVAPAAHLHA